MLCKYCHKPITTSIKGELQCAACYGDRPVQTREMRYPCLGCGKLKFLGDTCPRCHVSE